MSTVSTVGPWDDSCAVIGDRYPGLQGRGLQDRARADYVLPGLENITIHFFNQLTGEPNFKRHSLNDRDQKTTRDEYVAGIKLHGLTKGGRSESIGIPDGCVVPGNNKKEEPLNVKVYLIAGAHLVEGMYQAYREDPENRQVATSIEGGLSCPHWTLKRCCIWACFRNCGDNLS